MINLDGILVVNVTNQQIIKQTIILINQLQLNIILDLFGKLVMKSTSNVINVESLQKGSYTVRVFTNGRIINQPLYIR